MSRHAQSLAHPAVSGLRNGQKPAPQSSPARYKRDTVDSTLNFTLADARGELRDTMRGKIDIPPTTKGFMDLFMKDYYPELKENIFAGAPKFSTEPAMYQWITDTINHSDVINRKKLVCASTPNKSDRNDATHQAVDLGLYAPQFRPINEGDGEHNRRVNWSRIELSMECKVDPTEQDPFDETSDDLQPLAAARKKALGQILTYVENVFMHQHRTFHYMILFLGHYARIVHFDHSGVFSTIKFNYKTHGAILTTFLSRYSNYNAAERGHDPTATRLELRSPLVAKMRELGREKKEKDPDGHEQQMFNASLDNAWPWHKLEVRVQPKSDEPEPPRGRLRSSRPARVTRSFVVGRPHFDAGGVVGRGTRGYVAVEVDTAGELVGPFVYLKDAWRVDHPGIEQEGCVLETLNHNKVPFVPTLVCHGDLEGQVTKSQDAWAKRQVKSRGVKRTFKRHQHYRLVVAEVGKPLEQFSNGLKLVTAIYCCILAHQAAYERAGIIHRDISSGNILLYRGPNGIWMGLLNDWELSKKVDSPAARQPDRTGTWQFMSARALNHPEKEIAIEDEIEAFFHVLLYHAVRFIPNNIQPGSVPRFLEDYFDGCCVKDEEYGCGSTKLTAMRCGEIDLTSYNTTECSLMFLHPEDKNKTHILDSLISRLLISFKEVYSRDPESREQGVTQKADSASDFLAALQAMPNVPKPTVAAPTTPQKPNKSRSKGKSRASPKPVRRRGRKAAVASVATTAATSSRSRDGAISLKEHGPLVDLFFQCLQRTDWPVDDKGQDLRVKNVKAEATGHKLVSNTGKSASESTSKKRGRDDPQPVPGSSKRSRF